MTLVALLEQQKDLDEQAAAAAAGGRAEADPVPTLLSANDISELMQLGRYYSEHLQRDLKVGRGAGGRDAVLWGIAGGEEAWEAGCWYGSPGVASVCCETNEGYALRIIKSNMNTCNARCRRRWRNVWRSVRPSARRRWRSGWHAACGLASSTCEAAGACCSSRSSRASCRCRSSEQEQQRQQQGQAQAGIAAAVVAQRAVEGYTVAKGQRQRGCVGALGFGAG